MIEKVLAESDQPVLSVGSRRGALAGLLAGVAGMQAAHGKKKDRAKDKKKNKNTNKDENSGQEKVRPASKKRKGNRKGRGKAQPPTVIYVLNSSNITGVSGEVSGIAECPAGFVAIGGGFDVPGDFTDGLLAQFPEDEGSKWRVTINVPANQSPNVTMEITAICLKAKLEEEA